MKPLLIGESNPYGRDPRYALYCEPPQSAGGRLAYKIMGLTKRRYVELFDRANVCTGRWSLVRARQEAQRLKKLREPTDVVGPESVSTFVLLGSKVCRSFDLAFEPFSYGLRWGTQYMVVILPHPSGINRAWNEPGAVERARETLRQAGVLPPAAVELSQAEIDGDDDPDDEVVFTLRQRCSNCHESTVKNVCPDCGYDWGATTAEFG